MRDFAERPEIKAVFVKNVRVREYLQEYAETKKKLKVPDYYLKIEDKFKVKKLI